MRIALVGLIALGLIPLLGAFAANRRTSLAHALLWAVFAWLAWGVAFWFGDLDGPGLDAGRYCALCLTGCAGVAVLGARRPHVTAWNFVVLGLFAVMVLPLVESLFLGTHPGQDWLRIVFLAATVAIGVLNYVPTRFAPAAILLLLAGVAEMALLYASPWLPGAGQTAWLHGLLLATPWIAWMCLWRKENRHGEFDRIWLTFRDRWGLFWSQRVREQFNHAARNAGYPMKLLWRGLVRQPGASSLTAEDEEKILATLRAVLQRFLADPEAD